MPLIQRVPKLRGFTNPFRVEYQAINLDTIAESGLSADIAIATLIGEGNAGSLVWPQGAKRLPFDMGQYVPKPAEGDDGKAAARKKASTTGEGGA